MYIDEKIVHEFFDMLNNSVEYVLIKNINSELPDRLPNGKDIDILVKEDEIANFEQIMKTNGFKKLAHPLGKKNGWMFLYGLEEYQFWKKESYEKDFYIDASFKLSCKSLQHNTWIPLDRNIQERVWECKIWNDEIGCWNMDPETTYIYCLVRCIFDKAVFSEAYLYELSKLEKVINYDVVERYLKGVFFAFTDRLMELIRTKKYEDIRNCYLTFNQY